MSRECYVGFAPVISSKNKKAKHKSTTGCPAGFVIDSRSLDRKLVTVYFTYLWEVNRLLKQCIYGGEIIQLHPVPAVHPSRILGK